MQPNGPCGDMFGFLLQTLYNVETNIPSDRVTISSWTRIGWHHGKTLHHIKYLCVRLTQYSLRTCWQCKEAPMGKKMCPCLLTHLLNDNGFYIGMGMTIERFGG